MPAIKELLTKAKSLLSALVKNFRKAADSRADIPEKISGLVRKPGGLTDRLCGIFGKLAQFPRAKVHGKKQLLIRAGLALVFVALVVGVLFALIHGGGRSVGESPEQATVTRNTNADSPVSAPPETNGSGRGVIPPEEMFLPDEPDFVPGIMLERERRANWTAKDAEPFWQDPLKNGEEQWRQLLEKEIDELMERVP